MIYISPSLLAADFSRLGSEVAKIENAGADFLHLDVMDGNFVPNLSIGPCVVSALRKQSNLLFDVHLMITRPAFFADDFIKAGADMITFHYEACSDPEPLLRHIREMDCRASMAISPETPAEVLFPYLPLLDMVLIMTVHPGFGGQKLIPEVIPKIRTMKAEIDRQELSCDIEVDGGINPENVGSLSAAGANVIVAGSSVFKAPSMHRAVVELRNAAMKKSF